MSASSSAGACVLMAPNRSSVRYHMGVRDEAAATCAPQFASFQGATYSSAAPV